MSWVRWPTICHMERIADKGLALVACLALMAMSGRLEVRAVALLLVGVSLAAGFELACPRRSRVASAFAALAAACACLAPEASSLLPLVSYDLVRTPWPWLVAAPLAAALAWLAMGAMGWPSLALAALFSAAFALLSSRTGRMLETGARLRGLDDELSDRLLSLREKNRELEDARELSSRTATLSERTRIAREIHDGVGHLLTRLVLQVEALKVTHAGDSLVASELAELSDGLNAALDSMRRSMHALEDEGVDLGVELARLATGCADARVGVSCSAESAVPPEVTRCVLAVAREAVTNAARHAQARDISVRFTEYPGLWQLRVANGGLMPDPASLEEGRGMGLRSMRERVELLGGSLGWSVGTEFVVRASIPRGER